MSMIYALYRILNYMPICYLTLAGMYKLGTKLYRVSRSNPAILKLLNYFFPPILFLVRSL